jgi:hypothetical protein
LQKHINKGKYVHLDGYEEMLCSMYTKRRFDVSREIQFNAYTNAYKCVHCRTRSSTMDEAVQHLEGKHLDRGILICNGCCNTYKTRMAFRDHLQNCRLG